MTRALKHAVYWKLTRIRDFLPFLAPPLDYLRYEVFYPYDGMDFDL